MDCIVCYESKDLKKTTCCKQLICTTCIRKLIKPFRCPFCRDMDKFIPMRDNIIFKLGELIKDYSNDPRHGVFLNMTNNIYGEERSDLVNELLEEADREFPNTRPMIENLLNGRSRILRGFGVDED
jgi:hypothetical protein